MLIGTYLFEPIDGQGYICKTCREPVVLSLANKKTSELASYCKRHLGSWFTDNTDL